MNSSLLIVRTDPSFAAGEIRVEAKKQWKTDKQSLFGQTATNMRTPGRSGRPAGELDYLAFGNAAINSSHWYVSYCSAGRGAAYAGNVPDLNRVPYNNGVFASVDSGETWQVEQISSSYAIGPSLCRTKGYHYYFAIDRPAGEGHRLWSSRKVIAGGPWDSPSAVAKTFPNAYGSYVARAENDVVRLCWLDRRHEKTRLNLLNPNRQNYEVAYCSRRDTDANWSKDVILSKGLLYSFAPTIAVEGNRVVVAWAGISTARDWHAEHSPNDIYYVTSKDGGTTWSKLLKVTDAAKDGVTSGQPQVELLNGVIHLLYVQGKMNLAQESPGLTKLNQPPWPIYYQQRPFPD